MYNKVRVGITSYAQSELGDVVYIELPDLDRIVKAGTACTVVESVKAAYDIYAPVSGKVIEANTDLENNPQLVNEDPYGKGWFFYYRNGRPSRTNQTSVKQGL